MLSDPTWTLPEVIRMRTENQELRRQLEFVKNYRKIRQPLEEIAGNLPEQELGSLLKGLKQCQVRFYGKVKSHQRHLGVIVKRPVKKTILFLKMLNFIYHDF